MTTAKKMKDLAGIRGWLSFIAISSVIGIAAIPLAIFSNFDMLNHFTSVAATALPGLLALTLLDTAFYLAMGIVITWIMVLFFQKKKRICHATCLL